MSIVLNPREFRKTRGLLRSFLSFLLILSSSFPVHALPLAERVPAIGSAPLAILDSEPAGIFVPTFGDFKDKYVFTFEGAALTIIDTETWAAYATQPDDFTDTIVDVTLLGDGVTLVVALSNGNLARIDLSDESSFANTDTSEEETSDTDSENDTDNDVSDEEEEEEEEDTDDSREVNSSKNMTSAGITAIAADPGSTAETVYMINGSGQYYYEYNFATNNLSETSLSDSDTTDTTETDTTDDTSTTTDYTPVDIAYANVGSDVVLVSTDAESLLVFSPGSSSFTAVSLTARDSSESTPAFGAIALSTDGLHAFVLDTANDFVWVYSVVDGAFADQIDGGTDLDPIEFDSTDENAGLTGIAIFHDAVDDEDFAYVAGSLGLSVIDASSPDTKANDKLVDTDESTSDINEPIALTGSPVLIAASSEDDGYVYAANSDGTIAVVSDNPFVTVSASTAATVTEAAPTFALTFQSDEAGTYVVKTGSDPTGESGTALTATAGTVAAADTDVVTDTFSIEDFERDTFVEGDNKIFVFVTDADGFTGRDAYLLKVDRPPEQVEIASVNFGSRKVYVNFNQSPDADIDHYTLFAKPAASQSAPVCDSSLDFTSSDTVTATVSESACATDPCEGIVTGLENDVTYCVGVKVTDLSAQDSPVGAYTVPVTTQATVGPAEFLGETGCALFTGAKNITDPVPLRAPLGFAFFAIGALTWLFLRESGRAKKVIVFFLIFSGFSFQARTARAAEVPIDPEHFTLELRGGLWLPTRPQVKQFFSACCNPVGEIEFGYLHENRYNAILAVGFSYLTGNAIGITNGQASGDRFSLALLPIRADFAYRLDFVENQLLVPYVRAGFDAVLFRESSSGGNGAVQGCKFGLHGAGGVAILLDKVDTMTSLENTGSGINDVYLTLEGRFAYINSFRSTGLDLTGFYPYAGILFQF